MDGLFQPPDFVRKTGDRRSRHSGVVYAMALSPCRPVYFFFAKCVKVSAPSRRYLDQRQVMLASFASPKRVAIFAGVVVSPVWSESPRPGDCFIDLATPETGARENADQSPDDRAERATNPFAFLESPKTGLLRFGWGGRRRSAAKRAKISRCGPAVSRLPAPCQFPDEPSD
jgi:hypothetical protein